MSKLPILRACTRTYFSVHSSPIKQIRNADVSATLTHSSWANFFLIVLKSVKCSESHSVPVGNAIILISSNVSFRKILISLEFQYGSGVSVRMDPTDEVEVPDVKGTIGATGQSHWCEQHHVPCSAAAARTAGNAPVKPVAHHSADYRRLLGQVDVLPISFVKDSWQKSSSC